MNKKLSVLRRITAIVLCVTLLSSQVVVANDEDSERMDVQTNSEITDISEQDSFSSDTSETSDITEANVETGRDLQMKKKQLWMTKTHRTHWKK